MLDAAHLDRVLPRVGLHSDGEGLPRVTGVQAHRDGATGPDPLDAAGGTLDVGRVDVAAGHDDDVFHAAADDDVAVFGHIAEVTGVIPAVLVLRGDEATHGDVAVCEAFAAQLDDADAARRHHVALLVDDAGLEVGQQR